MLKAQRQSCIRTIINERGSATVSVLMEVLHVSDATVRRDLDALDEGGFLVRTHGGAVKLDQASPEPPLIRRHNVMAEQKDRIARRAAQLIRPGDTVFLGSGSTVARMATHLTGIDGLTVISNSLAVIDVLISAEDIGLVVIGGEFRRAELSMVGPTAIDAIRCFRADRTFMGVRAIDPEHGFTGDAVDETTTDRAILGIGAQSIILADHTKFAKVAVAFLAPIDSADIVVTDRGTDDSTIQLITDAGCHVIVEDVDPSDEAPRPVC